jgi:anaerobic magnesium-protoporphyrin IX monomethyl ester cyclase
VSILLLQEDTLDALVRSGAETIWVGAESGCAKNPGRDGQGHHGDQIYEATRLMKLKGIKVGFFIQFGYLGETRMTSIRR